MTKKKKGHDPEAGDEDGERSRTPIRSELDKQEGLFPLVVVAAVLIQVLVYKTPLQCYYPSREGADPSAGSFEPAHQAASEVAHPSFCTCCPLTDAHSVNQCYYACSKLVLGGAVHQYNLFVSSAGKIPTLSFHSQ